MMTPGKFRARNKNNGDHDPAECNHKVHGQYIHYKPVTTKDGKELVKIRQAEEVRDLIVPNTDPLEIPGIMPASEFQRLMKQATVMTPAEKRAIQEEAQMKKAQLFNESMQRKENMKKSQQIQNAVKGSVLDEVESEASKKSKYLLQRAYDLRQEQEDEIKGLNGIILASKCLAIREAQIAEKKIIQKELEEEEKRLDMMMEQQRQQGLEREKRKREKEEAQNHAFVMKIKEQVKEMEIQQLIEAERKAEEVRASAQARLAIQQEELDNLRQKKLKQKKIVEDIRKSNEDLERFKAMQREEERLADARLQEFMRKKAEREAILEREAKESLLAKEREIARLRAAQEKAADIQAQRDTMNAYRIQEEAEREWRRKEKEAAIKKKEMLTALRRDREKQIEDIRKAQALEIMKDEEEFHKVAKLQYESYLKEQEKIKERRMKAEKHRKEILKQVNEAEQERIQMRKSKIEEGNAIRLEQETRNLRVNEVLKKKIDELRKNNVPEHTINDIQRQMNMRLAKIRPQ